MITLEDVKKNEEVQKLIEGAQKQLDALGYTEHAIRHLTIVSERAGQILKALGYDEHTVELAKIAGFLHDIGNCINRVDHAHTGAILAYNILKDMDMPLDDCIQVLTAIGNHDEKSGNSVSEISAALILADKSDVHRSRVRNQNLASFEIHDKVNYAVTKSELSINSETRVLTLDLTTDTSICPMLDYFEIFMDRTMMSKFAAKYLNIWFELIINGTKLI